MQKKGRVIALLILIVIIALFYYGLVVNGKASYLDGKSQITGSNNLSFSKTGNSSVNSSNIQSGDNSSIIPGFNNADSSDLKYILYILGGLVLAFIIYQTIKYVMNINP